MAAKATHTPSRNVRVPDALWDAAMATTAVQGTTVSQIINEFLDGYVRAHEPEPKPRRARKKASA